MGPQSNSFGDMEDFFVLTHLFTNIYRVQKVNNSFQQKLILMGPLFLSKLAGYLNLSKTSSLARILICSCGSSRLLTVAPQTKVFNYLKKKEIQRVKIRRSCRSSQVLTHLRREWVEMISNGNQRISWSTIMWEPHLLPERSPIAFCRKFS